MTAQLLITEPYPEMQATLHQGLQAEGYSMATTPTGLEALAYSFQRSADLENAGRERTRESLLAEVFGASELGDPGSHIQTVRGSGYRFMPPQGSTPQTPTPGAG